MKLVTVETMRQLEQAADALGHSYAMMMEQAGRAVAQAIQSKLDVRHKRILALIGPGNNGGDGLVAAYHLHKADAQVAVYLWKTRDENDPNLHRVQEAGIPVIYLENDGDGQTLRKALRSADVIIDALLGTGVSRPITGTLQEILSLTRQEIERRKNTTAFPPLVAPAHPTPPPSTPLPLIVAVDIPSGIHCTTGQTDPATLPADITVTFAYPKQGQFTFPAADLIGELIVADIGIPPHLAADIPLELATGEEIARLLPPRPRNAHKGTFGRGLIVAGSTNYTGAAGLAAEAAIRSGAGLITLAVPEPLHAPLAARVPEATYLLLPHNLGVLTPDALPVITPILPKIRALLIGPGLGCEPETIRLIYHLLGITPPPRRRGFTSTTESSPELPDLPPCVIDADALNALAQLDGWWESLRAPCILTPHPGEMARLLHTETEAIAADRISTALNAARTWGQIVVLKGAFTIVAAPDGRATLIPFATPALATAGSGDVLAGTILGLLTQGLPPYQAAIAGTYLHGLAGSIAEEEIGKSGVIARDLLAYLPTATRRLRQTYPTGS